LRVLKRYETELGIPQALAFHSAKTR